MGCYFFGEELLFGCVHFQKFFEAGWPDAVEKAGCQAVNRKHFLELVAEIDQNEHSSYTVIKCQIFYLFEWENGRIPPCVVGLSAGDGLQPVPPYTVAVDVTPLVKVIS